jgi:hypothetical protein
MVDSCASCFYSRTDANNTYCNFNAPSKIIIGPDYPGPRWPVVPTTGWCGEGADINTGRPFAASGFAGGIVTVGDQAFTNTTVLADVTGLSANLAANITYQWVLTLYFTAAGGGSSGGLQVAMSGTVVGSVIYDGWQVDANTIAGQSQATALNTVVANAASKGVNAAAVVHGTIVVGTAGTLKVQAAQSVSNATPSTIKSGSFWSVRQVG